MLVHSHMNADRVSCSIQFSITHSKTSLRVAIMKFEGVVLSRLADSASSRPKCALISRMSLNLVFLSTSVGQENERPSQRQDAESQSS